MVPMAFGQILTSCRSSSSKIRRVDKDFARYFDFNNIKFSPKLDTFTKLKKKIVSISWFFWFWKQEKYLINVSKILSMGIFIYY